MRKTNYILLSVIIALLFASWWFFIRGSKEEGELLEVTVKKGSFRVEVTTTGELEAKSSENIYGPAGLRSVRIWQVKIEDMIPDGTVVDSGEYVAALDRTEISNNIKDVESDLEKLESQYTKTMLDTSLELRSARDELINLKYGLEEKKIVLEQSKFEPPATIRQAEIELEKGERAYDQAVKNYNLRLQKARANMQEVAASLEQTRRKYSQMSEILNEFTIMAPKAGMVIYKRNWDGQKQGIGATIGAWDNVVATLPNLTKMISKTFVNEIDISRIKTGQEVIIGIDAFPGKEYSGKVVEVANIGEQMRNSNAKVFEVKIEINENDSILRPAMTTKNTIITAILDSVVFIPLECVHNTDSITFVYKKDGRITRQEVITGLSNENEVVIGKGLLPGDIILITEPEEPTQYRLNRLTK